jgi:hypothetical protein
MPLLRSRLVQGGLCRHLYPTPPKKIQEEQSVNDVGEPRDVIAASMPLLPRRDKQLGVTIPTRRGRGRRGRAIRLRCLRAPLHRSRPWDNTVLGPPAAAGVLCSSAPDRGATGVGVRGGATARVPALPASSPAAGAGEGQGCLSAHWRPENQRFGGGINPETRLRDDGINQAATSIRRRRRGAAARRPGDTMRYPALAMLLAELGRARGAPLPLAPVVEGVGAAVEGVVPAESPEVDVAVLVGRSPVGQIERPRSSIRRPRAEDGGGGGREVCSVEEPRPSPSSCPSAMGGGGEAEGRRADEGARVGRMAWGGRQAIERPAAAAGARWRGRRTEVHRFRFWMENGGGRAEERERIMAAPSSLCAGSPAQVEGRRWGRRMRRGGGVQRWEGAGGGEGKRGRKFDQKKFFTSFFLGVETR